MSEIEGLRKDDGQYNASFYVSATTTSAWVEVPFTDIEDNQFPSSNILLRVPEGSAGDALISFDPSQEKKIHGQIDAEQDLMLRDKRATSIWIKRAASSDGTIRIFAWR